MTDVLWTHKIEVDAEEIGWHLTCRYPTPEEKGEASKLRGEIQKMQADAAPIPGGSKEELAGKLETIEGRREFVRYNADQDAISGEFGVRLIEAIAPCLEKATNGDGKEVINASEIIIQTDALWHDAYSVFGALFFRPAPIAGISKSETEATTGS